MPKWSLQLVALAALVLSGQTTPATATAAESDSQRAVLNTYQHEDGESYFALSVRPDIAPLPSSPANLLILFDTSASQTGVYAVGTPVAGFSDSSHSPEVSIQSRCRRASSRRAAAPLIRRWPSFNSASR